MLLFLDIETTGFDKEKDNIIEISAVRYDEGKKEIVARFDRILHLPEGKEVSPMIEGLTGISTKMCQDEGISLSQCQQEFSSFIRDDDIITGHNISFDTEFLNAFGFLNFEAFRHKEIDTFILSVLVLGQKEESHALEVLSEKYGIVHKNAHRAMSDVLANLEFYLILEKIYAHNFSEKFQNFLESFKANNQKFFFDEKYFFDQVKKKKELLKKQKSPEFLKNSFLVDSSSHLIENNFHEELFIKNISTQKNLLFETFNSYKYINSLVYIAQKYEKKISLFYPNKKKQQFYKIFERISQNFPKLQFFDDPQERICPQKFKKFLQKKTFDKFEAIVATKIFRSQELQQELFVRFMGDEWKTVRMLQGEKREDLSMIPQKMLPFSEAQYQKNRDEIRIFFGGENLENQLLEMQQKKQFSKRMIEDFSQKNDIDIKKEIEFILSKLSTSLRKEKGDNKYSIKIQWKDFSKIICREEAKKDFEKFLTQNFERFSELQKMHILNWFSFFDDPQKDEIKIIELYPDNSLAIETINPFFEESFQKICSQNESTFFFGKSFPKDFSNTIFFSFSEAKPELLKNFSFFSEKKFFPNVVFCPEFSRDATSKEIANLIQTHIKKNLHKNWIVSLTSKKNIGEVKEFLRGLCDEKGIKIFSSDSGGVGKIKKMMQKFPQKIVIGNTKFLEELEINPKNFSALFVHKIQFDHPKQPLIKTQRKRFQNDFEQYSIPRAISRLEKDIFQFSETHIGEEITVFLGEGRILNSSTFYSKFQNVFPKNTVFKNWEESI